METDPPKEGEGSPTNLGLPSIRLVTSNPKHTGQTVCPIALQVVLAKGFFETQVSKPDFRW